MSVRSEKWLGHWGYKLLWKVMHEIPLLKKNNGSCHIILSKNCEIDDSLTGIPKGRRNWNKMVRKFNATVAILLGALFHRNRFNAKAQASWAWLIDFLCASWLSLLTTSVVQSYNSLSTSENCRLLSSWAHISCSLALLSSLASLTDCTALVKRANS